MRDGWQTNQYNYRVVRMWDEDPEPYLTSGINLVPLAPITNVTEDELPGLVKRMEGRINAEPRPSARRSSGPPRTCLWGYGTRKRLRHICWKECTTCRNRLLIKRFSAKAPSRESSALLMLQGTRRFGKPDSATLTAIEAIRDIEKLDALGVRIVDPDVRDWNSLSARTMTGVSTEIDALLDMRGSITCQAIPRDGRITDEQRILIRLGTLRFGKPDGATLVKFEAFRDFGLLKALCKRILDAYVRDRAADTSDMVIRKARCTARAC